MIFALEVPDFASQHTQSVAAPAAYEGVYGNLLENVKPSFVILSCQQIESGSESTSAERVMDPALLTRILLKSRKNNVGDEKKMLVRVLEGPTHGKLRTEIANNGYQFFAYDPDPGFLGKDQVSFLVQYNGKMYKQIRTIQVVEQANERENQEVCPIDRVIKTPRSTRTSKNHGVKS